MPLVRARSNLLYSTDKTLFPMTSGKTIEKNMTEFLVCKISEAFQLPFYA